MIIYIDAKYKCHASNPENEHRGFDVAFFDGKCETFIEGYQYVPAEENYFRSDGVVFNGETVFPWKPYPELAAAQAQYELDQAELAAAYQEGVNSV